MLCPVYATMGQDRFTFLPDSTNAVESYNRTTKDGKGPEILQVFLMSLYKKDMVAVLEDLAESIGISTTYISQTPAARDKRNKKANAARRRKNAVDNDAQGPPDRNSDFKRLSRKRKATDDSSVPDKMVCIRIQRYYHYWTIFINTYVLISTPHFIIFFPWAYRI